MKVIYFGITKCDYKITILFGFLTSITSSSICALSITIISGAIYAL